ncbi:hypothetical protein GJ496_002239 [Pomphorhynchus laevis]|nr:hypothetical protein GJ496_002239 [Pomphorhynchus laevis]
MACTLNRLSNLEPKIVVESLRRYNFKRVHTIFHDRHTTKHPLRFHDDKWVRRRGGGWDEKLTKTNEEFITSLVNSQHRLDSPLKNPPWPRGKYSEQSVRTGVIALKIGSIPQWTKEGQKFNCTLLQILDNHVIDFLPPTDVRIPVWTTSKNLNLIDSTKTGVCVVGALSCDPRKFTRVYNNLFTKAGCPPKRKLSRFFVTPNAAIQPGTPLYASHFRVGDYVDVQAKTIDYGFHGCMRRYGFKGQNKAHGVTKSHRKRGSVGCGRKRRRIIAGTKMPGMMGNRLRFLRGLKIWRIDNKNNVIYVQGPCIPGPMHAFVRVHDSTIKSKQCLVTKDSHPPFPTYFPGSDEERQADEFDKDIHQFGEKSITY